jgi:hypothetical protein
MNRFQPASLCGRIRAVIATHDTPPDTGKIAATVGVRRCDVSRSLARMRRMGYVHQIRPATVGRYATAATWSVGKEKGS